MSTAVGQRKLDKPEKAKDKGRGAKNSAKAISPVIDGPVESDTTRPLDSEEIQALAIRAEELEKLHREKSSKRSIDEEEEQKAFMVVKTKTGPQKQPIQVAKITLNQPVQDQLLSAGLRFDTSGKLLPYSILGSLNEYTAELSELDAAGLSSTNTNKENIEDVPDLATYNKKPKRPTGSPDGGARSLNNWKYRMDERRQVMQTMSKELNRSPATLLMNQTDRWRERKELIDLMDTTLPLLQNGKNWRLHSEFWAQQQLIGDEDTGIHTTLTRTEIGCPLPVETIGKSNIGLHETGIDLTSKASDDLHKRQWFNSEYLEKRLNQLDPYMKEIVPHKADLSSLEVVGHNSLRRRSQQKNDIEVHVYGKSSEQDQDYETEIIDNIQTDDDTDINEKSGDTLDSRPDVGDLPIMGPALKIDTFVFQQMPYINEDEDLDFIYEIRVQFESQVKESVTRMVEIKNVGTTVFYYEWQQKPYTKPFDIVNSKVQRFYFDNRTSSILPNDNLKLSFVFKSNESGIFTERWQLLTRPVLCGGRPIIFTLRGVTTEEDIHRQTRLDIEQMLFHREAESIVRKIVDNILDNVRTPERARSPIGFYMTEQEQFQEKHPDLFFNHEVFEQIKNIYQQLVPADEDRKWDLKIDTIRQKILSLDEENPEKSNLLEQLNQAIHQLTLQPLKPSEQTTYLVCYDIMNQFIDSFVDEMILIHNKCQIAEPTVESYPDFDIYGNEFNTWKKNYEITKQQENEKRPKSAGGKDKKGAAGKGDRGKSPKKAPVPPTTPSGASKRGATSGSNSQMSKQSSFIDSEKPDKERVQLTQEQIDERLKLTQESYLPVYTLLCHTFDRLEQALDDLSGKSVSTNENALYTQLATSIQNQSLDILDILKDELTRNVMSVDMDNFF
ncbi:unnamed protein product [Adineta steineri]|uniref:MYCBP-associated protein n=1 Tax=Adineta steineri TaxID=433720 RepID=A0A813V940_9BILA|nr:unnamed protein product [Adineta steineri]CAF3733597.1 unnamed protein product [Adineta steineri]